MPFKDPEARRAWQQAYDARRSPRANRPGRVLIAARYRARHPDRAAAHAAVREAVRTGVLVREPCVVCGERADAHHGMGYEPEYRLVVTWLCGRHHREAHRVKVEADIAAIVANARSALLSELEEAVGGLPDWHQEDGCDGGHDYAGAIDRAAVIQLFRDKQPEEER